MPEWMMLPEALDPKLTVFLVLVGIILSLSYLGRKYQSQAKAGARPVKRRKKRELARVER